MMKLMEMAKLAQDFGLDVCSMWGAGHQKFIAVEHKDGGGDFVEIGRDKSDHDELTVARNLKKAAERIAQEKADAPRVAEWRASKKERAHLVMGDIEPYISQIDGSLIGSRSKHRTHLRDHHCIEVGNELKTLYANQTQPLKSPPGLKEEIIHQVNTKLRNQL